jgi:SAM-dependent methyltransferase
MTERKLHPWDELPRSGEKLRPAHVYASQRDWPGYFAAVAGKPARETCLKALELFAQEAPADATSLPHAIDLGCGEGRDSIALLNRGWRVTAIDGHPEAFERLLSRPDLPHKDRLSTILAPFESLELSPATFINASFAIPFCEPAAFPRMWSLIVEAILPGGRFAGQFFGERDTWASLPDRSHHTHDQVRELLAKFTVEEFREEESEGNDAHGKPKHWHVFHVVARRNPS